MGKVKINGKVIGFNENDLKLLSDEELEAATGGLVAEGYIIVFRYVCDKCGAAGPWCTLEDLHTPEVQNISHNNPACRGTFRSDPRAILLI